MSELIRKVSKRELPLIPSQAQRSHPNPQTHTRPYPCSPVPSELLRPRGSKAFSDAPQAPPRLPHLTAAAPPAPGFPAPTYDPLQAPPPFTTFTVPSLRPSPPQLLLTPPIHSILLMPVNPSSSSPLLTLRYPQASLTPLSPFLT